MNLVTDKMKNCLQNKDNLYCLIKEFKGKIKVFQKICNLDQKFYTRVLKFYCQILKSQIIKGPKQKNSQINNNEPL